MTTRVYSFPVVIPAGTPIANPVTVATKFDPAMQPVSVYIRVPPGPRGQVGFRVVSQSAQLVPWNNGAWLVTDNEEMTFDASDQPPSDSYAIEGYNLGAYDHSLLVRWTLTVAQSTAGGGVVPTPPLPLSLMQGGG